MRENSRADADQLPAEDVMRQSPTSVRAALLPAAVCLIAAVLAFAITWMF